MLDEDKVRERISLFYAGDDTSWNRGVVSLSALGAEVAPHILPLLDDENPFARAGAAEVFGRMRHAEAIPLLLKKLGDGDWFVRAKAAAALGKIGNACAAGPLKALFMREPHPWARESIAWALGQICEPGTIPTLCYALGDHYSGVVRTASRGLERMVPRNENDLRLLQNGISRLSLQKDVGTSRVDLEKCAGELRRTSRA